MGRREHVLWGTIPNIPDYAILLHVHSVVLFRIPMKYGAVVSIWFSLSLLRITAWTGSKHEFKRYVLVSAWKVIFELCEVLGMGYT